MKKKEPITEERLYNMAKFSYFKSLENGHPVVDHITQKPLSIEQIFNKLKKTFKDELKNSHKV